jgi:hypothetical protein
LPWPAACSGASLDGRCQVELAGLYQLLYFPRQATEDRVILYLPGRLDVSGLVAELAAGLRLSLRLGLSLVLLRVSGAKVAPSISTELCESLTWHEIFSLLLL